MIRSTEEKCGSRRAYLVVMQSNLFKCRESISGQHFCPLHYKHSPISADTHKRMRKMINYTFIFQLTMKAINSSCQSRRLQTDMDQIKPVNVTPRYFLISKSTHVQKMWYWYWYQILHCPKPFESIIVYYIWCPQNFFFFFYTVALSSADTWRINFNVSYWTKSTIT